MRLTIILCVVEVYCVYAAILKCNTEESTMPVNDSQLGPNGCSFNKTYPLTVSKVVANGTEYKIALIADLDSDSKLNGSDDTWISAILYGTLTWNSETKAVAIKFDSSPTVLTSSYNIGGRGMELSELVVYNGKLLTVDDRTGIIHQIEGDAVFPWVILADGNGHSDKGFKCEWATIKDDQLIVGSTGRDTLSASSERNSTNINNYMWIKIIDPAGHVKHINWQDNYKKLQKAADIEFPGYIIHESCVWSRIHEKWFFLPRRSSKQAWERFADQHRGTNLLLIADENFKNVNVKTIGDIVPVRGFSSFKFIPLSGDTIIAAIKSEETNDTTATYITVFTIDGTTLLQDTKISHLKYEGFEFV